MKGHAKLNAVSRCSQLRCRRARWSHVCRWFAAQMFDQLAMSPTRFGLLAVFRDAHTLSVLVSIQPLPPVRLPVREYAMTETVLTVALILAIVMAPIRPIHPARTMNVPVIPLASVLPAIWKRVAAVAVHAVVFELTDILQVPVHPNRCARDPT